MWGVFSTYQSIDASKECLFAKDDGMCWLIILRSKDGGDDLVKMVVMIKFL